MTELTRDLGRIIQVWPAQYQVCDCILSRFKISDISPIYWISVGVETISTIDNQLSENQEKIDNIDDISVLD